MFKDKNFIYQKKTSILSEFDRVVFTSDFLKVDDRAADPLQSPQDLNTLWLYKILSSAISSILSKDSYPLLGQKYPDPLSRISVYRQMYRELSGKGWSSIYNVIDDEIVVSRIADRLSGSLVVSFEAPGYLVKLMNDHGIPFVDFTIHPIRFLQDYVFGMRTNISSVQERIPQLSINDDIIEDYARISTARTMRVYQNRPIKPGSGVFFGQIGVDASLISGGVMAGIDEVADAIIKMKAEHPNVYYKAHPHAESLDKLKKLVNDLEVNWLEANAYDILASPEVQSVGSMSSGILHEAQYFGVNTKRYLAIDPPYAPRGADHLQAARLGLYLPMNPAVLSKPALSYLFGSGSTPPPLSELDPYLGALKYSLNMKWGR